MTGKRLVILSLLIVAVHVLQGQSYYFTHYQVENGLSNNAVICSMQDSKGFLWFGTKDGLNRFDGYSFKVFRNDADDPQSIGSNFIYALFEDRKGVLWVGCDRGLYKYNANTETFHRVEKAPMHEVMDIQIGNNGDCWFVCRTLLYRYNETAGSLTVINKPGSFEVTSICATEDGIIWAASVAGTINRIDPYDNSIKTYSVLDPSNRTTSKWIEKLYDTKKGSLLVGTAKQGAWLFSISTGECHKVLTYAADNPDIFVRDFIHHNGDEYWIATESGIFIYTMHDGHVVNLKKNYNNPYSISDNAVYTFCRDKEGGIWAGTYFGGLNYYPRQYTSFRKFFPEYGKNAISGNAVREIRQDGQGNMWIGTEDAGLNKMDMTTGHFTHFHPDSLQHTVSHTNLHGLLIHGDELWIGTFHHGLDVLNTRTGKIVRHYGAASHKIASDFIYCLYKTRSGTIIAGTDRGLFYYDPKLDDFTAITQVPPGFYTIIYEDRVGTIWAGTYSEGLFYFNPNTKQAGSYKYYANDRSSLAGNRVNWIFEDSRQDLWVAVEGGLCRLYRQKNAFKRYTSHDGLPSNIVFAVLEDAQKNFWASTSKGLACFSPATGHIKVYTKANGLLSDQFNYNSAYKDPSGRMYFGSVKGMISFHPDEFIKNDFLPPVYITGFQVYDKELGINKEGSPLKKSITSTEVITLRYNQSSFSINFAALSYTAPQMTEYAYKMEGLDKDWTHLTTNRKAYFTRLSPGTYEFNVKASNSSGIWSSQPARLTIRILPPFWASTWAYIFYVVLAAGIIYWLVHNYHKRIAEKNKRNLDLLEHEMEKEIYQAKIEFFTHVAHEIRTPLTLIKGPMEKIIKQADAVPAIRNNLQIMQRNTNRLLALTSQLLDFRKTEIKSFSLNFVKANIIDIIKDNYAQFWAAAEQEGLCFRLHAPDELYAYVDVEALNKIISNLLDNAIKYAKSKVFICVEPITEEHTLFAIEIKNDGRLIPPEMKEKIFETFFRIKETEKQSGTGIGLALARSLAELHKGKLYLKHPEGDLNVFALELPVHQEIEFNLGGSK